MKLSIIITHHKTPELLTICLQSIQNTIGNINHEIFIADSETDESAKEEIESQFPEIIFLDSQENLGYSKIVNRAILKASGEYLLVLNADIIATKNAISSLIEYLEQNPAVGMVGPRLTNFDGTTQCSRFKFYSPTTILYRRTFLGKMKWGKNKLNKTLISDLPMDGKNLKPYEADWLMGSSLLIRAEALEKVGLLDERFFMYFEDMDWCHRFKDLGYKIMYFPQATMYHYHIRISYKRGGAMDLLFNPHARIHVSSALKYFLKYHKKIA